MNTKSQATNQLNTTRINAPKALKIATQLLFGTAVIGQLIFVYYIISFYGGSTINGDFAQWNKVMHHGLIDDDWIGNFFLMLHIFLAAVITFGGPLQFIPKIRIKFPVFHRWNGRIYIVTAFLISIAGLYMVHARGVIGGNIMKLGNTINASMIMIFAGMAWRTAVKRDFISHKIWAIRTFLVVSGVWFFRIGFGLWIILNGGSAPGSTETLEGPFDQFLALAHALLPLIIFELYRVVKNTENRKGQLVMTGFLGVLTIALAAGIFMATMIFWIH